MTLKNEDGYGCIYCIINKINGKKYVGQTSKLYLSDRFGAHKFNARNDVSGYLYNAMRKYGEENFEIKVLIHGIPIDKLDFYEILWIKKLNTKSPNGYNMTDGGDGTHGFIPCNKGVPRSQETINKIKSHYTPERRKEVSKRVSGKSNPMYGRKGELNPAYGKNYWNGQTGILKELFKGKNNPFYGKHHSEETKAKLSKAHNDSKQRVAMCDIKTEEVVKIFDSYAEAARYLRENTKYIKADDSAISKCARGKMNHTYGYKWKKLEGVTTNCRDEIDTSRSA